MSLIILREIPKSRAGKARVLCQCLCGNLIERVRYWITSKSSCGCLSRENARLLGRSQTKHGDASNHKRRPTTEYNSWIGMKQRCFNSNTARYMFYGGRGITVCDRWKASYENFLTDMGRKPGRRYSIDRINADGNYEPSNCRWATDTEQRHNRQI